MLHLPEITLVPGESGENVLTLQKLLAARGNYLGERDFTGQYDNVTFNAVWRFQKDYRLYPDGIAGPLTIRALNSGRRGDADADALDATAIAGMGGSIYATYVAAEVLDEVWKEEVDPSIKREEEIQKDPLQKEQKLPQQQEIMTQQQLRQNVLEQRELRQQQGRERTELQGKAMEVSSQEITARETLRQQQNIAAQERVTEQRTDRQAAEKQVPEKQVHVRERVLEQEKGLELQERIKNAQGKEAPVQNAAQSRGPRLESQVETSKDGVAREATVNANQKQQEVNKAPEQDKQVLRAEDKGKKIDGKDKDAQVASEKAENIAKGRQDKEAAADVGKSKDAKQQTNEKQVELQKEQSQRELRDKQEGKEKGEKEEKRGKEPERKEKPTGLSEFDDKKNLHAKLSEKQEKPEEKSKEDRREEKREAREERREEKREAREERREEREARREEKAAERAENPFTKGGIVYNGDVKEIPAAPQSGLPMNKAAQGQSAGRMS